MQRVYIVYACIPIVSAMIGWITNYIAVKMIFRPRRPVNVLGLKIQGLIPRRQIDLGHNLGDLVEKELVSHEDVKKVLESPEIQTSITNLIEQQVDKFVTEKLGTNPMIAMFLQGELATKIKTMLVDQLKSVIPGFLDTCMVHVEKKLDFKAIVQQKVESFDYIKLEEIVFRIAAKELKMIEILGAVLGFIVGLAQVGLLLLLS